MSGLIDTTEMYLKTIYEAMEDGVVPMRARIVERLGHSGPTVSQTVARMERDGLLFLEEDRQIGLTEEGKKIAVGVIRKHRLAECLLIDVLGMPWETVHEESCRWEHVIGDKALERIAAVLNNPTHDPYGNPIPPEKIEHRAEISLEKMLEISLPEDGNAVVSRIGEPVQADMELLADLAAAGIRPGVKVSINPGKTHVLLQKSESGGSGNGAENVVFPGDLVSHLFFKA